MPPTPESDVPAHAAIGCNGKSPLNTHATTTHHAGVSESDATLAGVSSTHCERAVYILHMIHCKHPSQQHDQRRDAMAYRTQISYRRGFITGFPRQRKAGTQSLQGNPGLVQNGARVNTNTNRASRARLEAKRIQATTSKLRAWSRLLTSSSETNSIMMASRA